MSNRTTQADDLLWVTNVPTPYRAPLWSALSEQHGLTVALLADSEPNRSWKVDLDRDRYAVVSLNARPVTQHGDSTIYAPSLQLLNLISKRPRAVVLDGWESPAFLAARWWAKRRRVPVIASYRSTLATHRYSSGPVPALRKWFFHGADSVLTAGQASTEAVTSMGVSRSRIVEGFNTVDVARFAGGAVRHRASHPSRPGHHYLYVGQFIARKNVENLVRAFADVRDPADTLTLVGEGPLEQRCQSLCEAMDLGHSVTFTGNLDGDALVRAYAGANTLVLPSTEEVWGLVVNEGLASGLHVVVSARCGIAPSIAGMPGVILTEPTPSALSTALRQSRDTWSTHLREHPVTRHTPVALSKIIIDALPGSHRTPRSVSR